MKWSDVKKVSDCSVNKFSMLKKRHSQAKKPKLNNEDAGHQPEEKRRRMEEGGRRTKNRNDKLFDTPYLLYQSSRKSKVLKL